MHRAHFSHARCLSPQWASRATRATRRCATGRTLSWTLTASRPSTRRPAAPTTTPTTTTRTTTRRACVRTSNRASCELCAHICANKRTSCLFLLKDSWTDLLSHFHVCLSRAATWICCCCCCCLLDSWMKKAQRPFGLKKKKLHELDKLSSSKEASVTFPVCLCSTCKHL